MDRRTITRISILTLIFFVSGCASLSNSEKQGEGPFAMERLHLSVDGSPSQALNQSVERENGALEAKYTLARHFQKLGKHRIAVEILRELVSVDPLNAEAHNALGISHDQLGEFETAQACYAIALSIDATLDNVLNNLGYSFILAKNYSAAVQALEQAVQRNSQNPRYHKNLGLAHFYNGSYDLASREFRIAQGTADADRTMEKLSAAAGIQLPAANQKTHRMKKEAEPHAIKTREFAAVGKTESVVAAPQADQHTEVVSSQSTIFEKTHIATNEVAALQPAKAPVGDAAKERRTASFISDAAQLQLALAAIKEAVDLREKTLSPNEAVALQPAEAGAGDPTGMPSAMSSMSDAAQLQLALAAIKEAVALREEMPYPNEAAELQPTETTSASEAIKLQPPESFVAGAVEVQPILTVTNDAVDLAPEEQSSASTDTAMPTIYLSSLQPEEPVIIVPPVAEIEISNGNGVWRMARHVGEFLKNRGLAVTRLTNADHFGYSETVVYYRSGFKSEAHSLAGSLPVLHRPIPLAEAKLTRQPIRLLIGKDLVPFNDVFSGRLKLEISNGNGVNGMARRIRDYLKGRDIQVGRLTNADHFKHSETVVYYAKGQEMNARFLAMELPGSGVKKFVESDQLMAQVRVLLGSDMVF